ncbi:MAG: FAD-dependent oxidoreductase [Oscillospiraceae bacterium]|jgi:NAD(P)H-nitrite reductase large subunit|nr:FAD-dependent oxidoreductase [Oscillospiraceae bacterium]
MSNYKYVIIGNSAAAVGCVEGIRRIDETGSILIISDEQHHTYGRPLISYLLLGKTDLQRMKYRPDDWYTVNNVDTKLGVRATAIDAAAHTVTLDGGEVIGYEKLLAATGSNPFVPPMGGLDTVPHKFTFQTLDSAIALGEAITPESRVLIIGAGLIGLKCAEGIIDRVQSITFIDMADRVLPSILDAEASAIIKTRCEEVGIRFHLGDSVKEFIGRHAVTNQGLELDFDIAVLAVGVRPNIALVKDAGGDCGRAITVDERSATSLPDVYAAGDCTETRNAVTGDTMVMAILPNAYLQGETAGINMAGVPYTFTKAIPCNAIGFFGKHILSGGAYVGETHFENDGNSYRKLFYSDDHLNGFILIGDKHPPEGETPAFDRAGIYTNMIRERTSLATVDFDAIARHPGLAAFAPSVRAEYLGGER